jgi:hypothetical protein
LVFVAALREAGGCGETIYLCPARTGPSSDSVLWAFSFPGPYSGGVDQDHDGEYVDRIRGCLGLPGDSHKEWSSLGAVLLPAATYERCTRRMGRSHPDGSNPQLSVGSGEAFSAGGVGSAAGGSPGSWPDGFWRKDRPPEGSLPLDFLVCCLVPQRGACRTPDGWDSTTHHGAIRTPDAITESRRVHRQEWSW